MIWKWPTSGRTLRDATSSINWFAENLNKSCSRPSRPRCRILSSDTTSAVTPTATAWAWGKKPGKSLTANAQKNRGGEERNLNQTGARSKSLDTKQKGPPPETGDGPLEQSQSGRLDTVRTFYDRHLGLGSQVAAILRKVVRLHVTVRLRSPGPASGGTLNSKTVMPSLSGATAGSTAYSGWSQFDTQKSVKSATGSSASSKPKYEGYMPSPNPEENSTAEPFGVSIWTHDRVCL